MNQEKCFAPKTNFRLFLSKTESSVEVNGGKKKRQCIKVPKPFTAQKL